jgi:uncharacterized membrane protein
LAVARHDDLRTNAFDLGYVSNALWHTAHGAPFRFTTLEGATFAPDGLDVTRIRRPHSLLAFHVEPVLLLLAPLYGVWPEPRWLLWLQAIAVAAGALPAAWLARTVVGSGAAGAVFGIAWLLAPGLEGAALSDFHAVAMASTWLVTALWLLESGRRRAALALFALTVLSREDAAVMVASVGAALVVGARVGVWRADIGAVGRWLLVGGGAWAALCFAVVMPFFSGGGSLFASRYAWLWREPGSISTPEIGSYLALQLLTGGILCLLAPLPLLAAAPLLAMNALSGFDWMRSGGAHYSALLVPVLLWAGARGAARVGRRPVGPFGRGRARRAPLVVVLVAALGAHAWAGASPLRPGFAWPEPAARAAAVPAALAAVPDRAPVSATSGLLPHLAARDQAGWFPAGVDTAEWVVVDVLGATHPLTAVEVRGAARRLVDEGRFEVVAARDGVAVLRRGVSTAGRLEPVAAEPEGIERAALARFGPSLELLDHRLRRWPEVGLFGDVGALETLWRVSAPIEDDLAFALATTRRSDGALVGLERDAAAAALWYPTSRWRTGEVVRLEMPVARLAGLEALGVAVMTRSGTRLRVHPAAGRLMPRWEADTVLGLARV